MKKRVSYSHKELAAMFFPGIQPCSASKQLSRWIAKDEELYADLIKAGYVRKQRTYSPLQTAILFDHMGDPENWNIK